MFAADIKKFWFLRGVVKHGLCIHSSLSLSLLSLHTKKFISLSLSLSAFSPHKKKSS
jgi:hypothetical protein